MKWIYIIGYLFGIFKYKADAFDFITETSHSFNLMLTAMQRLWYETFHDKQAYIHRIFDHWVDMEHSMVRTTPNGILKAMLCAHEFRFAGNLRALYLHGLATAPDWRRKGIMTDLIHNCACNARKKGFDFLFLVPANDRLRRYYEGLDFRSIAERSYALLPIGNSCVQKAAFAETLTCLQRLELSQPEGSLLHTTADWQVVLEEWIESGNEIFLSAPNSFMLYNQRAVMAIDNFLLQQLPELTGNTKRVYLHPQQISFVRHHTQIHTEPYAMVLPLRAGLPKTFYVSFLMD